MAKGKGKIRVFVRIVPGESKTLLVASGSSIQDVLSILSINRETIVVRRDGRLIPESEKILKNDRLEIVSIISGG